TIYLTVDGCDRALVYRVPFPRQGNAGSFSQKFEAELHLPPSLLTAPTPKYPLPLQLENVPPEVRIEVEMDRANNGRFELQERALVGDRQKRILFSPFGADGMLFFGSVVEDWVAWLNLEGLHGDRRVRVRVKSAKDPGGKPIIERTATIKVDATEPEGVRFVRLDSKAVASQKEIKILRPASG